MSTGLVRFIADLSSRWRSRSSPSRPEHLRLGTHGEKLACRFLRRNGYKVLYRNFRGRSGGEIDIVCRDNDTLVFVEVKTRRREDFGRPFDAVDRNKQKRIARGGLAWLRLLESFAQFQALSGKKDLALAVLDRGDDFAPERPSLQALRKAVTAGISTPPMIVTARDGAAEVLFGVGTAIRREGSEAFSKLYLELALAARPKEDVTLVQLAALAEEIGQPKNAIELYQQVEPSSPYKRAAELQLGLALADLDQRDEAVKHLSALLDAEPTDTRAYLALGGVYGAKKDFKSAAAVYDRAVTAIIAPLRSHWNLFYQRGIAYEQLDIWPKAEESFRKALQLYPDQPQVLNYLGYSYVDQNKNLDEALGMIRKAVELRPDDGYIVDSLGWAYYRLGKFEDSVNELERAIKLRPEDATINDHLGDAYWRVGRKLEARFQWQHAIDGKPEAGELVKIQTKLRAEAPAVAEANAKG